MSTLIQVRQGTAAAWTAMNTLLAAGEIGYETDTGKLKIGNGTSHWTVLGYMPVASDLATITAAAAAAQATANAAVPQSTTVNGHPLSAPVTVTAADVGLGNANNVSDLNKPVSTATQTALNAKADLVGGLVPTSQIPAIALTNAVSVASQAAMLALTTSQVQPGDLAVRTDGAGSFILTSADPSQLANWTRINAPTDVVTSVNGQQGTVILGKADVGLGSADNTPDATKNIGGNAATATLAASATKLATARSIAGSAFDGTADISIGLTPTSVKTGAYTAVANDLVLVDATSGNVPIALPSAPADKTTIGIEKLDNSQNVITISVGGADKFYTSTGPTSFTISLQYSYSRLVYSSATALWHVQRSSPFASVDRAYRFTWARDVELIWTGVITRDANGAATSATVTWPDGSSGTYTGTASSLWPGAVDSYTVTHTSSGKTYTQPSVTRNASGDITTQPAITES